jgi:hypothetical protein
MSGWRIFSSNSSKKILPFKGVNMSMRSPAMMKQGGERVRAWIQPILAYV